MKHLVAVACSLIIVGLAVSCNRAPDGVIPESTMEDLIVDLEMADAYIDSHWDQFPNDSSRLVLKQSIFMKHDVTPELYDTSLVWYARNMDVYLKVYDNVIERLKNMSEDASKDRLNYTVDMTAQHGPNAGGKHSFDAQGDSADIWHGPRRWVLPASMKYGFITFDFKPDREYARGDRYELQFKLKQLRSNFKTFIAVDYEDGSTAIAHRYSCNDGWNSLPIQSDNKKTVRRIYGYVNYNVMRGDIAFVDSLLMLRTHCGENIINEVGQKLIERNKSAAPASSMAEEKKPDAPVAPVRTDSAVARGSYKPKEGVNKSSASLHVTSSPNADHLPKR